MPSTLETIDFAMYEFLDKELDVHSETNEGWKKSTSYLGYIGKGSAITPRSRNQRQVWNLKVAPDFSGVELQYRKICSAIKPCRVVFQMCLTQKAAQLW